jgi:multisubunit Na+/H+ antiporter MnhB subunit
MRTAVLLLTLLMLLLALVWAFLDAPLLDAPLGQVAEVYNQRTLAEVGATNVGSAINFDWRSYDTLGAAAILMTAATGVTAILRPYLHRRRETGVS